MLQFAQDHSSHFGRREDASAGCDADDGINSLIGGGHEVEPLGFDILDAFAHQSLRGIDRALRMMEQNRARGFPRDDGVVAGDGHDAGYDSCQDARASGLHDSGQAVGGAEIDTEDAFFGFSKVNLKHGIRVPFRFPARDSRCTSGDSNEREDGRAIRGSACCPRR